MRDIPIGHNTTVNPRADVDPVSYLKAIGYTQARRQWVGNYSNREQYRATYLSNTDTYRKYMRRISARTRYWARKLDNIIRDHSCAKCHLWTGTYYLTQLPSGDCICDACK